MMRETDEAGNVTLIVQHSSSGNLFGDPIVHVAVNQFSVTACETLAIGISGK